ncbi:MAG: Rieske (2Fe-2S) protein [Chloroflexota bacterium]|nr:Rieske (2Fe-2S) protein [Chloroflexota bacterium]
MTTAERTDVTPLDAITRRQFLEWLSIVLSAWGAAIVGIPILGFVLSPLIQKPPQLWRAVGAPESFAVGETVQVAFLDPSPLPWAGVSAQTAAWLRRENAEEFTAFAVNCTHVGCPVRWLRDADLFMCPCHGGVYYKDGSVAAGPPPRSLVRYDVRVQNGQVEILTRPIPIG